MLQSSLSALAIFLGSFLLFAVQPMMGRMLLPSFGGSAAVWTVCLAAFQILLLAGYGYAHGLARRPFDCQRRLHGCLLALAIVWMCGLLLLRRWLLPHVGTSSVPPLEVLACVVVGIGLPYVLLASGSSLLQAWLAQGGPDRRVYGLYAISNLGSLLGLFSYPLAAEPFVSLTWQWGGWTIGLGVYVLLVMNTKCGVGNAERGVGNAECGVGNAECGVGNAECGVGNAECGKGKNEIQAVLESPNSELCIPNFAFRTRDSAFRTPHPAFESAFPAALSRSWVWFALPACSSYLLVAMTNHLSLDVEPVPLMWVFLLGAFLLSYTIGFSGWAHKALPLWLCLAAAAVGVQAGYGIKPARGGGFLMEMLRGGAVLLLAGVFLHSWLYQVRPHTDRLTAFYLSIAVGGAAGGAAASLLSPLLFRQVLEYPLALVFCAALVAWFVWRLQHRELKGLNEIMLLACLAVPLLLAWQLAGQGRDVIFRARNFYGALRVTESRQKAVQHTLMNGETMHGLQSFASRASHLGTSYYGPLGGGFAVQQHPAYSNRALRVGCIGLGAGTMSVYGRTNDVYRFLEINPQVVTVAENTNLFTYLADCEARVQLAVGDARKTLVSEAARGDPPYDVLIVDAYSGDAIPIHLATREAFQLYLRRLAPDGILAVHISNWHINLLPLCKAAGQALQLQVQGVVSAPDPAKFTMAAEWVFMSRKAIHFNLPAGMAREVNWSRVRDMRMLTDERGGLVELIRFNRRPPLQENGASVDELERALFR